MNFLIFAFIFSFSFALLTHSTKINASGNGAEENEDLELKRQILALDNYIYSQMIVKQPNKTSTPPPEDVPDMSIFSQLYATAVDHIKAKGMCTGCKIGIGFLMYKVRVSKFNATDIIRVTTFACKLFNIAVKEVCAGIIERYGPTFSFLFAERPELTAEQFCGVMMQSYGCRTYAESLNWTVDIPPASSTPPAEEDLKEMKSIIKNSPLVRRKLGFRSKRAVDNSGRIKIIQMSDLHIDPLYEPGANAECDNKILCCQASQGRPLDPSLQAGYYGDHRKCDVPYSTLDLTLKHIAETHSDVKLFYMTGDVVPHNIWYTTQADNTKILNTTASYILKYFPSTPVIPVLGNHDPHPVNFFSPQGVPPEVSTNWIYPTTYDSYKQWIPADQSELYLSYGYYAVQVTEKFKLLVLNTNFCYEFNVWQMYEPGDTGDQLKWLINHLQEAEAKNQTVHIVGHVPPGHDECYHVFSRNFYNIILRYHRIIKGQFYGHTHYSELKVLYDLNEQPINTLWISPSLTPYEVNHVAYRVYYADPKNYEILDHETWIFDLKSANMNVTNQLKWFSLYSGSEAYGLDDVTPKSMGIFMKRMTKSSKAFQKFYQHYFKLLDDDESVPCNTHCRKRLLCGFARSYAGEEENCNRIQKEIDGVVLPISLLSDDDDEGLNGSTISD